MSSSDADSGFGSSDTGNAGTTDSPFGDDVSERYDRSSVGGFLDASVDSRWWYWIAAVPAYFLLGLVLGLFAFGLLGTAFLFDLAGGAGVASLGVVTLLVIGAALFALPGLAIAVLFPLAMYVDARAVRRSNVGWDPDPVLYGLIAAVGVVVTNFLVSVPLAVYYLYRRHKTVGTP